MNFIYSGTGVTPLTLYYVIVDGLCNGLDSLKQSNLINDKINVLL